MNFHPVDHMIKVIFRIDLFRVRVDSDEGDAFWLKFLCYLAGDLVRADDVGAVVAGEEDDQRWRLCKVFKSVSFAVGGGKIEIWSGIPILERKRHRSPSFALLISNLMNFGMLIAPSFLNSGLREDSTMRKQWIILAFVCIFGCFNIPLSGGETLHFDGDSRNWIFGGKTKLGETTFIPEGQNAKEWTDAVILNEIPAQGVTLEEYYKTFMATLNDKSGNIFQSKVLESDPNRIIFEWWIDSAIPGAQHGWIKITKKKDGLQFFRYTTKDMSKVEEARSNWVKILTNTDVVAMDPTNLNFNVDFKKDGREWTQGYKAPGIVEFVVDGQSVENWKELFTIQFFTKIDMTLPDYYEGFIEGLKTKTKDKVTSNIIESNENMIFFEWSIDQGPEAQHEWALVRKVDPNLITVMRYTTKNLGEVDNMRGTWSDILKNGSTDVTYTYKFLKHDETQKTPEENHESTSKVRT